jgi:ABC-2 type transport system ATP-binding protein
MINAEHLSKAFGLHTAVADVSLSVAAGEIYGLVGPDGAGKTTLLRLLVGALTPDTGTATVSNYSIGKQTEQARANIGYLSQRFSLYEDLTVLENIRFFAEVRGLQAKEWFPRCLDILEFVGLAMFKDRLAGQLSGGMKQKLGLATALVTRPRVLLLDEPTTGVDPVTRQDFWQLIIRLASVTASETPSDSAGDRDRQNGAVTIIITTPYMDEAARCNRLGFMSYGRIIATGTPMELRSLLKDQIIELTGPDLRKLREIVARESEVEDVHAFGDRLHLRVKSGTAQTVIKTLEETLNRNLLGQVTARPIAATLEDVFMALSEKE